MSDIYESPNYSGRPMDITDISNYNQAINMIPKDSKIVTIEAARKSLQRASRLLIELQSISDIASDLTEDIDIVMETHDSTHEHVSEIADYLAKIIHSWHSTVKKLQSFGARMACLEPGRLEWYGVVDNQIVLYSWCLGEQDIEWYHDINSSFLSRKPLIEA